MARLEALLIDVGGTLVRDETWLPVEVYRDRMGARISALYGGEEPAWARELLATSFSVEDAPRYEHRVADQVTAFLADRGVAASPDEVTRICRACALPLHQVVDVEPDARAALEQARRLGLRIAICSNTLWRDDEDSRRDWTEMDMGDLFDAFVTSNGTGRAKPHRRMFERALELIGARPESAAIVGDQLARDIVGGRAVGLRTIWKRPAWHRGPVDPTPDATIETLSELAPILADWVAEPPH